MLDTTQCLQWLADWAREAERWWYAIPGSTGQGCYGTGYNSWGVQTNQKYLGAMAVLATKGESVDGLDTQWAADRALAALRFSLASHKVGNGTCTDGSQWGHTWISALGVERMMYGVALLDQAGLLPDEDRANVARLLASEADWLTTDYHRGQGKGVCAAKWGDSGHNDPESNLWNGAIIWRAMQANPGHPNADAWRERSEAFLFNGVSVEADSDDPRFVGANFFPNYALDHHAYTNVGYMIICTSQAAMLHFDAKLFGYEPPGLIHHHQKDLWNVLRRMVFADGRLARIGGDTRVRYCYCQEYLLPTLLYAADHLGDSHATALAEAQLAMIDVERQHNGDGSFFSKRLAPIEARSPYYYTRLESDRASAIGMAIAYAPLVEAAQTPRESFEASVAGPWCEAEYGAAMHRSETRFASFAWRATGLAQGICQPPDDGHLAEWEQNLAGCVHVASMAHKGAATPRQRQLGAYHVAAFDGGFATIGSVIEGANVTFAEGWNGKDSVTHHMAFVALPDDHTVVGLQYAVVGDHRVYIDQITGLHLNVPNDLYNDYSRGLITADGERMLLCPPDGDGVVPLSSPWVNIEGRIGVAGIYGAGQLSVDRAVAQRGGPLGSLHTEVIGWPCERRMRAADAGSVVLDAGWAVVSSVDAKRTAAFAATAEAIDLDQPAVRAVRVTGIDGNVYIVAANFGADECDLSSHVGGKALAGDPSKLTSRGGGGGGVCVLRV